MEIYKSIPELPAGCEISNLGNVRSEKGKVYSKNLSNSGYLCTVAHKKNYWIHRLVAIAFIPRVEGKNIINHKNGIKTDNRIENLEWCTLGENAQHARDTGLNTHKPLHYKGKFGFDHNKSKAVKCRETGKVYGSMSEAERLLNIGQGGVSYSINKKTHIKGMHFETAI